MKLDILFNSPEIIGSKILTRPHMGISYLRSYLENKNLKTNFTRHKKILSLDEYLNFILSFKTKILAFSLTDDTLELYLVLLKKIRQKSPKTKIVIGGAFAREESAEYLLKNKYCDSVIIGEGEIPCFNYIIALKNKQTINNIPGVATWNIIKNQMNYVENIEKLDINSYPSPILSNIVKEKDLVENGIFSSRGCFHRCIYCSFSTLSNWNVRYYDENRFLQEIKKIALASKKFNQKDSIPIWDDAFTLNPERAKKILKKIIEMNLDVTFWLQTRVDKIDEDLIILLKKAGVNHVGLGLESSSVKVLKEIKKIRLTNFEDKTFDLEKKHLEKFKRFKEMARKHKLEYTINIIVGLPNETFNDAINTLKFTRELQPLYYFHNIIRLYTGVPLTKNYKKYGYKISSKNNESLSHQNPVKAKIEKYNYNVLDVPPLPNRHMTNEWLLINGLLVNDKELDSVLILKNNLFLNNHLEKILKLTGKQILKEITFKKRELERDFSLKTTSQYHTLDLDKSILDSKEINLSFLNEFYEQLIKKYKKEEYKRYTDLSNSFLSINLSHKDDFDLFFEVFKKFKDGGEIILPPNFLSIQFKKIILKDKCRWSDKCPAKTGKRLYLLNEDEVETCENGFKTKIDDYQQEILKKFKDTEIIRECKKCLVYENCSKCISIPKEYVSQYCNFQRNKFNIKSFITKLNYIITQFLDPTDLKIYKINNIKLIIPPKGIYSKEIFILKIDKQNYFVIDFMKENRMFKLNEKLLGILLLQWENNLTKEIFEKQNYNLNEIQIIEKNLKLLNKLGGN